LGWLFRLSIMPRTHPACELERGGVGPQLRKEHGGAEGGLEEADRRVLELALRVDRAGRGGAGAREKAEDPEEDLERKHPRKNEILHGGIFVFPSLFHERISKKHRVDRKRL
jgi:hypothetical protein